jgi:spore coat polysaccharide biosynthesis protein SpsF
MRVVVVVQARTGSSRLPGKVLMPLAGRPMLERMLERIWAATTPDDVVVATTTGPDDDEIYDLSIAAGTSCYRGDSADLLDRHLRAARRAYADVVVKIPSDCPLISPSVIDRVIGFFKEHAGRFDYVSNLHPPSHPDGNDVEVMPFAVLQTAWHEAREAHEREHTTPFIWEHPERFRVGNVRLEACLDFSASHRWTVDYPEDYALVSAVYDALWSPRSTFEIDDVLAFLEARPDVARLNACHHGRSWYADRLVALNTRAGSGAPA